MMSNYDGNLTRPIGPDFPDGYPTKDDRPLFPNVNPYLTKPKDYFPMFRDHIRFAEEANKAGYVTSWGTFDTIVHDTETGAPGVPHSILDMDYDFNRRLEKAS